MNLRSTLSFAAILVAGTTLTVNAQTPVDIGLRSAGENLEVVLRPGADFNGIVSSVVFTVRWDRSTGATLGELQQEGLPAQYIPVQRSGELREVGGQNYQVFAGFGTRPLHTLNSPWTAMKEYVIATIPVNGAADFELVNDGWTGEAVNNADYYLSLGGVDRTGIIYKSLANADATGGVDILPNPNNGIFTFTFEVEEATDVAVELVNAAGQIVFTDVKNQFTGTFRRDMNISGMSSGVYVLKVTRGDSVTSHKVVYQK